MSENNKIELQGIFSEGYGFIPKKIMKMNIHKNVKLILAYMLSHTGAGKNSCFPSYSKMAKDLKLSKSTVSQNIKYLLDNGFIEVINQFTENKFKKSNKYVLKFLDPKFIYCTDGSTQYSTTDSTHVVPETVHNVYRNNNNNNNIINNNSNGTELYHKIFNAFNSVEKIDNYAVEGKSIKQIIKKAKLNHKKDYEAFILNMIKMFYYLQTKTNEKFWKDQPFTASRLNSNGIWQAVKKAITNKVEDLNQEEKYKQIGKELFK